MFQYMQVGFDAHHSRTQESGEEPPARIRLSELLGSGRHGMVFRGEQRIGDDERAVAVKIPGSPGGLDHERSALMLLRHRNIVTMLDRPLPNGALVLEHCDLGTLADHLADHALTLGELRWLFDALLPAVEHIHETGWIHGDISPGNIGVRTVEGPVLLDFATARPADGSFIDEGTAEFAGPLRIADPRLDIRCLATTALAALGASDRWDHKKRLVRDELSNLVQRCDESEPVDLHDLAAVTRDLPSKKPTGLAPLHAAGGGPESSTTTRAFGPRPAGELVSLPDQTAWKQRWILVVVVALIAGAICWELAPERNRPIDIRVDPTQAPTPIVEHTAQETLEQGAATWDSVTGVISLETTTESVTRLAVGERGDVAAIGDWSCDGTKTLGIYRPATGNWFVFDSWDNDSSAVPTLLDRGDHLLVRTDGDGCAVPLIR